MLARIYDMLVPERNDAMKKYQALLNMIGGSKKCAVCFSGGADSFMLILAAKVALGAENVTALTLNTEFYPREDIDNAVSIVKSLGVKHIILPLTLLNDSNICKNDDMRCYYCKRSMLECAIKVAKERDLGTIFEGTNASDIADHSASMQACSELGIKSPLMECGITKPEILDLLSSKGFFEIVRPSDACLASRIRYDEEITPEKLRMTDIAEDYIKIFGYKVLRVRNVGGVARIELDKKDIDRFRARHLAKVKAKLIELGYSDVYVADEGYVHGSMNRKK